MIAYLTELADMARVGTNEAYYGTHEQIAAQNDFTDILDQVLTGKLTSEETAAFDAYCNKATGDEILDEGLRLARVALGRTGG